MSENNRPPEQSSSSTRRTLLKALSSTAAVSGIPAAIGRTRAASTYNDYMQDQANTHGETESEGEDDDPCTSSSGGLTTDCTSYSDQWKAYFNFNDGYSETQYGTRTTERDVDAETKYDSTGGTTYNIYISDSDIDDFQNHKQGVKQDLRDSQGSGAPTADETSPTSVSVGSAGTSTTLYSTDIEYGNVDVGGRVSGVLDNTLVPLAEYAYADYESGGRAEASAVSNFAGGTFAWSEVFSHVSISGTRSAEVDLVFSGNWEANLFAALGSAAFTVDGFVREVTDTSTTLVKSQEIVERSQNIVSNNGDSLTDPSSYNPFFYEEANFSDDNSNTVPFSKLEPGKEYHIGIRLKVDTETFTTGPGSGRAHVSDLSSKTSNAEGNLGGTQSGKKNFVSLDSIEIQWE